MLFSEKSFSFLSVPSYPRMNNTSFRAFLGSGPIRLACCVWLFTCACSCHVLDVALREKMIPGEARPLNEPFGTEADAKQAAASRHQEHAKMLKSVRLPRMALDGVTYREAITLLHTAANREISKHNGRGFSIVVRAPHGNDDILARQLHLILNSASVYDDCLALGKAMGLQVRYERGIFFFEQQAE